MMIIFQWFLKLKKLAAEQGGIGLEILIPKQMLQRLK